MRPSGTVTFLFSDIEGSTQLLSDLGAERYCAILDQHRALLRDASSRLAVMILAAPAIRCSSHSAAQDALRGAFATTASRAALGDRADGAWNAGRAFGFERAVGEALRA